MGAETATELVQGREKGTLTALFGDALVKHLASKLTELGIEPKVYDAAMASFRNVRDSIPPGEIKDTYAKLEWAASASARVREAVAGGKDFVFNLIKPALTAEAPFVNVLPKDIFQIIETISARAEGGIGKAEVWAVLATIDKAKGARAALTRVGDGIGGNISAARDRVEVGFAKAGNQVRKGLGKSLTDARVFIGNGKAEIGTRVNTIFASLLRSPLAGKT